MADKTLKATLIADDKMSAVFKKAGESGKTLSQALKESGTAGTAAAKGFDAAEKSSKTLGSSLQQAGKQADTFRDRFEASARAAEESNQKYEASNRVMRDIGISAGIVTAGLGLASQSFREQQIALSTLDRSYGDASDQMRDFAQMIQDTTNYSNDAAVASANIAATLARNYGLTADEIQRVIQISTDLAATSGLGLEDTTYRVVAAIRGEAEAAEALGLTMNQQSIDRENLTLTMSNEEAAHFRLNALYEQAAFAQGAAAQQADSYYGKLTQGRDVLQDWVQTLGGALGPFGEFGAFAADNAVQIGAMTVALGQMISTGSKLKTITTQMLEAKAAGSAAQGVLGTAGLAGSAGIAGLGIAAAAAAVGGIYLLGTALKADLPEASQESIDSMQALINKVVEAGDKSEYAITLLKLDDVMAANKVAVDSYSGSAEALAATQADLAHQFDLSKISAEEAMLPLDSEIFSRLTEQQKDLIDTNDDMRISVEEMNTAVADWAANAEAAAAVNEGLGAGLDELATIWQMSGDAAQFAQSEAMNYTSALIAGEIGPEKYEQLLQGLITGYENSGEAALEAASAQDTLTASINRSLGVNAIANMQERENASAQHETYEALLRRIAAEERAAMIAREGAQYQHENLEENRASVAALNEHTAAIERQAMAQREAQQYQHLNTEEARESFAATQVAAAAVEHRAMVERELASAQHESYDAMRERVAKEKEALKDLQQQYADTFNQMQESATIVADNLDTVFGAIVGNTDKIAKNAQSVMDWADHLIGAAGTWAEIDQLLLDGAITLDDYTAAQGAYNDIAAANASIQQDVLSIQTQLAPVVATATEALAAQMDQIADGSTDAQLFALGMMDATTSSQALALAQAYLADQDTFGPMLVQAAKLNPMLAQILEEMGLISYDPAEGTVTLTGADEAQSELSLLKGAMDDLNRTVATLVAILDDDPFTNTADDVLAKMDELDGDEANPTANLNDNATPVLGGILALLDALDGRVATNYVNTVYQVSGAGAVGVGYLSERHGGVPGFEHGGTIGDYLQTVPGYAKGGVVVELAEAGRERLHYATGGYTDVYDRGLYNVQPGTYVSPANVTHDAPGGMTFNITFAGNISGADRAELRSWAAQELIPSFKQVIEDTWRGLPG